MDISQYPARFKVSGVLVNVFRKPEGKDKEGRVFGGEWCLQLMSADHLRNGESKLVPTDLLVDSQAEADKFRGMLGKPVVLPCTVYVGRSNQLVVAYARGTADGK
jgi:hypothetical protein